MNPAPSAATATDWRQRMYQKSALDQERFRQITRYLGSAGSGNCLDVSVGDRGLSAQLRTLPGRWTTAAVDPVLADELRATLPPDSVVDVVDGRLPFADHSFDFVILPDVLPAMSDDYGFIRECHRVLKPKSYLLATVPNLKKFSCSQAIRRLLGLSPMRRGFVRPGYNERDLYDLFKDGYDSVEAHTWSRFFAETAGAITQVIVSAALGGARPGSSEPGDQAALARACTLLGILRPFTRLAMALDGLLLRYTRGHQRNALLKTRMWIPRREVKIRDGRSIADATINTRIGTAKEF